MKRTKGKLRGWRGVSKSGQRKINGYALGWKTPRAEAAVEQRCDIRFISIGITERIMVA